MSGMAGSISLINYANNTNLNNTQDFQKKAQEDREQKQKLERDTAQKLTKELVQNIISAHNQTLKEAEFYYQVTFCETKYCHRYINFEIEIEQKEAFSKILDQFIDHQK